MKKLLTCLFSLLMAVAILSPVSMRAAQKDYSIEFDVADKDFYVLVDDTDFDNLSDVEGLFNTKGSMLAYDGDLDYVNKDLAGVTVEADVYLVKGNGSEELVYSNVYDGSSIIDALKAKVSEFDEGSYVTVTFYTTIDYIKNGDFYNPTKVVNSDGDDDRDQTVVTIKEEGWSTRTGGTDRYAESQYVADDDKILEDVIEGLDNYDVTKRLGSGRDRKEFHMVYYIEGNTVTGEWEECEESSIVWGAKKAETPVYDELDTNHDGVVSCDEAHGEGWVWNEDKKACVYTGSTTSTVIVNTATK